MRTADVKVGAKYLFNGNEVTVTKKISGNETSKPNMQSGTMFTGFKRARKRFLLDNGMEVFSDKLTQIK